MLDVHGKKDTMNATYNTCRIMVRVEFQEAPATNGANTTIRVDKIARYTLARGQTWYIDFFYSNDE
jgi:hypothetical protein